MSEAYDELLDNTADAHTIIRRAQARGGKLTAAEIDELHGIFNAIDNLAAEILQDPGGELFEDDD